MGTYYTATALIGYKVSTKQSYETVKVPSCSHSKDNDARYCPTCGVMVSSDTRHREKEGWEEFIDFANQLKKPFVFEIDGEFAEAFWIGIGCTAEPGYANMAAMGSTENARTLVAGLLQPFIDKGLIKLDAKDFGLWVTCIGH